MEVISILLFIKKITDSYVLINLNRGFDSE